jgi:hypothetical protein
MKAAHKKTVREAIELISKGRMMLEDLHNELCEEWDEMSEKSQESEAGQEFERFKDAVEEHKDNAERAEDGLQEFAS